MIKFQDPNFLQKSDENLEIKSISNFESPNFPPELWVGIFQFLTPRERVKIKNSEFENAAQLTLTNSEIEILIKNPNRDENEIIEKEIDRGFLCNNLHGLARYEKLDRISDKKMVQNLDKNLAQKIYWDHTFIRSCFIRALKCVRLIL